MTEVNEKNERRRALAAKRLTSAIKHIDKAIATLNSTRERFVYGSPDFVLATNVLGSLNEARADAVTAARRNGVVFGFNNEIIE